MSRSQLEKETRKIFRTTERIDRKNVEKIIRIVLADNMVSRTEKRFIKDLMRQDSCDQDVAIRLAALLHTAAARESINH